MTSVTSRRATALWLCGAVFFVAVKFAMAWAYSHDRLAVWGDNDDYGYLLKAAQAEQCAEPCPAVDDIRWLTSQDSEEERIRWRRLRQYHRVVYRFHPLHSQLVRGVHGVLGGADWSWERSFGLSYFLGMAWLSAGVILLLGALFPRHAAGVALLFAALMVTRGHGLERFVPFEFALGTIFMVWACIAQRWRAAPIVVLAGIAVAIGFHRGGQMLGLISLAYYALWIPMGRLSTRAAFLGLGGLIVVSPNLLALLRPDLPLSLTPYSVLPLYLAHWSEIVPRHLRFGWVAIDMSLSSAFLHSLLGLAWIALGLRFAWHERMRAPLVLLVCMLPFALLSFLVWAPHSGRAGHFNRVWTALAVLSFGFAGLALAQSFSYLRSAAPRLRRAVAAAGLLLAAVAWVVGSAAYAQRIAAHAGRPDPLVRPAQVQRMLEASHATDAFYYDDESVLYFALIHGGLARGAVMGSTISARSELVERGLLERLRFALLEGPLEFGYLRLPAKGSLRLQGLAGRPAALRIASEASARLRVEGETTETVELHAGETRWLALPLQADTLRIWIEPGDAGVRLEGIRVGPVQERYWPWDQGVSLQRLNRRGGERGAAIEFALSLDSRSGCQLGPVLDDFGFAVWTRIDCAD